MNLTDRTAIITGASSGIGAATAHTLADNGCAVALAARRTDRLHHLADQLDAEDTLVAPTDITDHDDVTTLLEDTVAEFGGIDILVNNAGIARNGIVDTVDLEQLHAPIDVNLLGTITVTHAALPHLQDSTFGDIVTISSMNARHPAENASTYTASKYGINGFQDSLRKQLSDQDIRVITIMPGPVVTEMSDWSDWDGRALDPENVADTIAFTITQPPHVELQDVTINSTDKLD